MRYFKLLRKLSRGLRLCAPTVFNGDITPADMAEADPPPPAFFDLCQCWSSHHLHT